MWLEITIELVYMYRQYGFVQSINGFINKSQLFI